MKDTYDLVKELKLICYVPVLPIAARVDAEFGTHNVEAILADLGVSASESGTKVSPLVPINDRLSETR